MSWEIVRSAPAVRNMRRLDREVARRVRDTLIRLAETGQGDVTRLRDLRSRVAADQVVMSQAGFGGGIDVQGEGID